MDPPPPAAAPLQRSWRAVIGRKGWEGWVTEHPIVLLQIDLVRLGGTLTDENDEAQRGQKTCTAFTAEEQQVVTGALFSLTAKLMAFVCHCSLPPSTVGPRSAPWLRGWV